jgi:hypothetical protein
MDQRMADLCQEEKLRILKALACGTWHQVEALRSGIPDVVAREYYDLTGSFIDGTEAEQRRWARGMLVNRAADALVAEGLCEARGSAARKAVRLIGVAGVTALSDRPGETGEEDSGPSPRTRTAPLANKVGASTAGNAEAESGPTQEKTTQSTKGRRGKSRDRAMLAKLGGTPEPPPAAAGATPSDGPTIDPEFAALVPPPSPDERAQLENNLLADRRCTAPLTVWRGPNLLLDGHTRLSLCQQHGLPYEVVAIDLPDRTAALNWIVKNQLGRRNLRAEQASWLRGRRYLAERQTHGGDRKSASRGQAAHLKTAERLAKECHVDARTIRRDGKFAENVQKVAGNSGADAVGLLLSRHAKPTRRKVATLAALEPKAQRHIVQTLEQGGALTVPQPGQAARAARLNVPAEPEALAEAVLDKLGTDGATAVLQALECLLQAAKPARAPTGRPKK